MALPAHTQRARALEHIASNVCALALHVANPSRSIARSDSLTAEGERLAALLHAEADEVRALFRGR